MQPISGNTGHLCPASEKLSKGAMKAGSMARQDGLQADDVNSQLSDIRRSCEDAVRLKGDRAKIAEGKASG